MTEAVEHLGRCPICKRYIHVYLRPGDTNSNIKCADCQYQMELISWPRED